MVYNLARIFSFVGLIALLIFLYYAASIFLFPFDVQFSGPKPGAVVPPSIWDDIAKYMPIIALCSMLVALVGTSSTIILGWRTDRRQSAEYKLKIEQLELQLIEARKKVAEPA